MTTATTIGAAACHVLLTASPAQKVDLTHKYARRWHNGALTTDLDVQPPARPARPEKPKLLLPRDMPRRGGAGSHQNRIALLHALAHIELNAIDLAWDMIIRFGHNMPRDFFTDWIKVADDEARHFLMLCKRLQDMGARYGDLPAHDGLWITAEDTAHDFLGRLAVVPMVLEARGLDVTPDTVSRMQQLGDHVTAALLHEIYEDEIIHVRVGEKWFSTICIDTDRDRHKTYQEKVKTYFKGQLRPPFNVHARDLAGLDEDYYTPLVI